MACGNCGSDIAAETESCAVCAETAIRCGRCGVRNPSDFSYCSECGSRLENASAGQAAADLIAPPDKARAASPLLLHPDASASGRRELTLMFCDLVGSTELSMRLDPEELRAHVRIYQTHCMGAISRFGGHVAQFLGDGIMACFGYPQSRGGEADRAVRAGLGIIAELPALNAELAQPILVRIGIHTGAVIMGERELFGAAPSIAARIQAAAAPNQVAISEQTRRALETAFECDAIESPAAALRIYRVRRALG